jgi:hypothetical protein
MTSDDEMAELYLLGDTLADLCIRDAEIRAHGQRSETLDENYLKLVSDMRSRYDRHEADIVIAWAQAAGTKVKNGHRNGPAANCSICSRVQAPQSAPILV